MHKIGTFGSAFSLWSINILIFHEIFTEANEPECITDYLHHSEKNFTFKS